MSDKNYEDDASPNAKYEAKQLFQEAYQAQLAENFEEAIELYKKSIEVYPTAEAHTFLGWTYSFQAPWATPSPSARRRSRWTPTSGTPTTTSAPTSSRWASSTRRSPGWSRPAAPPATRRRTTPTSTSAVSTSRRRCTT